MTVAEKVVVTAILLGSMGGGGLLAYALVSLPPVVVLEGLESAAAAVFVVTLVAIWRS